MHQPAPRRVGYGTFTLSGTAFQPPSPTPGVTPRLSHQSLRTSHDPACTTDGPLACRQFRLNPVRSPLLGVSRLLSLRPGTEMFQFPGGPHQPYRFGLACPPMKGDGLPHSDITGSWPACGSPVRFVARHVLPRHWFPEHPPYALVRLTPPRPPTGGTGQGQTYEAVGSWQLAAGSSYSANSPLPLAHRLSA